MVNKGDFKSKASNTLMHGRSNARNQVTHMIKNAKRNYFKLSFQESKGNPRSIWKLIKSLTGNKVPRQPIYFKTTGDKIISSAIDIANNFNHYFTTVSDVIKDNFGFINIIPNFDKLTQYELVEDI